MSWSDILEKAHNALTQEYREFLNSNHSYFPRNYLKAFEDLPLHKVKRILFGQDPYPRKQSAIGVSFIDGAVKSVWSQNGLSKEVNRATSLRNFIKMQLKAQGLLANPTQENIAKLDKSARINSIYELKTNFEKNGVLLLNTALVFTSKEQTKLQVKSFEPFVRVILEELAHNEIELILFGNIAKEIKKALPKSHNYKIFEFVHPYNLSFIEDEKTLCYFTKMNLI